MERRYDGTSKPNSLEINRSSVQNRSQQTGPARRVPYSVHRKKTCGHRGGFWHCSNKPLEPGSADELIKRLNDSVDQDIRPQFEHVLWSRSLKTDDVETNEFSPTIENLSHNVIFIPVHLTFCPNLRSLKAMGCSDEILWQCEMP